MRLSISLDGDNGSVARERRSRTAGFTLIEIMVVMVIIAVLTGVALLSVGTGGREKDMALEARRLAALMELAREQAIIRGEELAVQFEESSYRFMRLDQQRWLPITDDNLLRERLLPDGIELELKIDDLALVMKTDKGESDDSDEEDENANKPMVFLLSGGEVTAFEATFSAEETDATFVIKGDFLGEIELNPDSADQ